MIKRYLTTRNLISLVITLVIFVLVYLSRFETLPTWFLDSCSALWSIMLIASLVAMLAGHIPKKERFINAGLPSAEDDSRA